MTLATLSLAAAQLLCGFTVVRTPGQNTPITWSGPVSMTYDQDGATAITDGSDIIAIKAAFAAWNAVACSTFRFADGGAVADGSAATNTIYFAHTSGAFGGGDMIAAYTVRTNSGGTWTGAKILVSDYGRAWGTNGDLRDYDLQTTITHELGHVLGLDHSADPHATMYYGGRPGRTFGRTPAADDVAGVCSLYPTSAAPCGSNADCPILDDKQGGTATVTVCSSGQCNLGGQRGYGEDCLADGDCLSGMCVRFDNAPATDPGVCTQACPCPGTDVCDANDYCAARQGSCPSCGTDQACDADIDGGIVCLATCLNDGNCQNGICFEPNGADDAGLCRVPGPKADGLTCTDPSDCASLVCSVFPSGHITCTGTELATPTITEDPPPPPADSGEPDGGPSGGDGGDGATQSDTDDFVPGDEEPLTKGASGGCAEAAPSFGLALAAVVLVLLTRRRWNDNS